MPHDIPVGPTTLRSSFSVGCSRFLALLLCTTTIVSAQQALTLKIRPADGAQLQQSLAVNQRRSIIVVVEDSTGAPVSQAAVSFRLPEQGPTGLFSNGMRSEIAITDATGRATLAPIQWGETPGMVPLRVMAAKGQLRAGVILNIEVRAGSAVPTDVLVAVASKPLAGRAKPSSVAQRGSTGAEQGPARGPEPRPARGPEPLAKPVQNPIALGAMIAPPKPQVPVDLQTPKYDPPGFWKSKWFVVALAAGGAVAGGYAATKLRNRRTNGTPYEFVPGNISQVPVVIGPPLISVGKP